MFEGTWIHESDWQWQTLPVIRLDMASVVGSTPEIIRQRLLNELVKAAERLDAMDAYHTIPETFLKNLIIYLAKRAPVVVIIDEYDKPMLDVIDKGSEAFDGVRDMLRVLYVQLKSSSEYLRCVFLTGVYRFTQTSIFSGLNNLNDLTTKTVASELLGYTEDEIRSNFTEHLAALAKVTGQTVDGMVTQLRDQFNGYSFGINFSTGQVSSSVYNPFAIGCTFADQEVRRNWFQSGTASSLIALLDREHFSTLAACGGLRV